MNTGSQLPRQVLYVSAEHVDTDRPHDGSFYRLDRDGTWQGPFKTHQELRETLWGRVRTLPDMK